jgi:8-oxo-dGTP pyrophosphatase MutT (NUDIX family)
MSAPATDADALAPDARVLALRRAVAGHQPADATEAAHRAAILALLDDDAGGDCLRRTRFTPGHVTASAFCLSADLRQVLLVHHRVLARWLQPGGHVEEGDVDIVAAARREVAEETGLVAAQALADGLFDVDVHDIPARAGARPEPAHRHFDVRIALVAPAGADAAAGDGVSAVRWVDLDAFERLAGEGGLLTDESVMRAIRRLRAKIAQLDAKEPTP